MARKMTKDPSMSYHDMINILKEIHRIIFLHPEENIVFQLIVIE